MAETDVPQAQVTPETPRIGVDEWVAREEERRREEGLTGLLRRLGATVPWWAFVLGATAAAVLFGAVVDDQYLLQVGFDTLVYVLLALGLNVVVGWAGLLDLGYVVFLGVGDYGAIVTLFVLQIFITFSNNGDTLSLPFFGKTNLTNGANGIHPIDSFDLLVWEASSVRDYFFVALALAVLLLTALQLLNESRTGRAWRALREDPLAANLLSIPVNRLKLLAFVFGAAVGGLAGTIFAASQNAVFPPDFNLQKLILIYAMVILGGAGSIAGVVLGAIIVNVSDRLLTTPEHARYFFYGAIVLALLAAAGPRRWGWKWTASLVAATIGVGFAVHAIASAVWPSGVHGNTAGEGWLTNGLSHWVLVPRDSFNLSRYGYAAMVALVVALAFVRGIGRRFLLLPLLYLAA